MKTIKNYIFISLISIFIIFMVLMITISSAFTIPYADDFSNAYYLGGIYEDLKDCLSSSMEYTRNIYSSWQGTYFSCFIQSMLSPFNGYGFQQLKYVMIINSLLFFASVALFISVFISKVFSSRKILSKIIVIAVVIFELTAYEYYTEVFYWYTGAIQYSFPLSLCLIGLSTFMLMGSNSVSIIYFVITLLSGIASMGGSLAISGFGCFYILILFILFILKNEKIHKSQLVLVIIWFICALINLLAPGNFVRHAYEANDTEVHFLDGIIDSIFLVETRYQYLFSNSSFSVMLLLTLTIGIILLEKSCQICKTKIVTIALINIIAPCFVALPVVMGYGMVYLPNRCAFALDVAIYISSCILCLCLSFLIKQKLKKQIFLPCLMIGLTVCYMLDGFGLSDIKFITIAKKIRSNEYSDYYSDCKNIIEMLEEYNQGDDIVIDSSSIPNNVSPLSTFVNDDPNSFYNQRLALFYGLNSINVQNKN